ERAATKPVIYSEGQPARRLKIIDVRSEKAYLGKEGLGAVRHIPNMDALNVPWTQFFTSSLRPNVEIGAKIKAIGITPADRILVVDEAGVSSAAVVMALRAMGFDNAANVSGGLTDLMSATN
ncbi:MAG: hypothetical protein EOP05_09195, partial [Proteobacteria bacterium]